MDLFKEALYRKGGSGNYHEDSAEYQFLNKKKGVRQEARNKLKKDLYNELKHVNEEEE